MLGMVRPAEAQTSWPFAGADLNNSHASYTHPGPNQISPGTVSRLAVKWTFTSHDSITATPTVEVGGLYVPDWAGYLYKIDPTSGALIWSHRLGDYTGNYGSYARVSPAISATSIVIGDRAAGRVMAINKTTGALIWSTLVDTHINAAVSSSPVIVNGVVYVGIASTEEAVAITASYVPTFRGSVAALDLTTGQLLWKFVTVPAGYAGGGVWGSSLAISTSSNTVYATTGNNYGVPGGVAGCVTAAGMNFAAQQACVDPTDYFDAILALDSKTGALKWARRVQGDDTWTVGCLLPAKPGCPNPVGPDADFASAPNLVALTDFQGVPDDHGGTSNGLLLGAGEKSGAYWAVNPANGGLFWKNRLAVGSIQWGSAVGSLWPGNSIFVAMNNGGHQTSTFKGRVGGGPVVWNGGGWLAIDAYTGNTLWQVPGSAKDLVTPQFAASSPGFVSYTNHLMFAGDTGGSFYAFNAGTGYRSWSFYTGATVESAPAIFNDTLYWGVGYPHDVGGHTLYAFAVP